MDVPFIAAILGTVVLNYYAYRYINSQPIHQTPLEDWAHKLFPHLENYYINDIMTISPFIFALFNLTSGQLRKFIMMFCITYTVRAISFCITHMPAAYECDKSNMFNSCNDLMFSGHTTMTVLSLWALHYWRGLPIWFVAPYFLVTIGFILAPRYHYSSDVLIASVISTSIFHNLK